jgi:uncharacterized protein YceH (UPF0502 family)
MTHDTESEIANPAKQAIFTPVEARIVGCMIEKRWTTPNNYPLTLNSLVQACNQKTNRNPVMRLEVGEVGRVVNQLRDRDLIQASFSTRAERYELNLGSLLSPDSRQRAALAVLMLRGPQTLGELRINASRMVEFDDLAAMQETLDLLTTHASPLVVKLPRVPGQREDRYAHLLCGEVKLEQPIEKVPQSDHSEDRIAVLEQKVQSLRAEMEVLWRLTGFESQRPSPDEDD